jgi:uncharacterized phiE125 gp8 family phage protein
MDLLLPVAPGGLDGRGTYCVRHWRDIPRSDAIEVAQLGEEPLSVAAAKAHLRISFNDDDEWIADTIGVARRQVELDTNLALVQTTYQMTFDQFPLERAFPLPRAPLASVTSVSSFDLLTGAESTFSTANYLVDTSSMPGRVCLVPGAIWPTGVRWFQGGKVLWTAGPVTAAALARYVHAMKLLIANWYLNREAAIVTRGAPEIYPLGYEALLGDRLVSLG